MHIFCYQTLTPSHLFCVNKLISHPESQGACHKAWYNARKFSWKQTNKTVCLWLQGILTDPGQTWKETKLLLCSFQVSWRHLKRSFLAAIWEMGWFRPTSQTVPPAPRSVWVPDNPPKNMWNCHCDCKIRSTAMGTNGSIAIWLRLMCFWLML